MANIKNDIAFILIVTGAAVLTNAGIRYCMRKDRGCDGKDTAMEINTWILSDNKE